MLRGLGDGFLLFTAHRCQRQLNMVLAHDQVGRDASAVMNSFKVVGDLIKLKSLTKFY